MTEPEQNTGLLLFYPYRAMEARVLAALADGRPRGHPRPGPAAAAGRRARAAG